MPLPFIIAGVAVGALLLHGEKKSHLKNQDSNRHIHPNDAMGREPSEILPSPKLAQLVPGSIVCCEVYEAFVHTGIVIDRNTIVELHGNGLVRAISPQRLLSKRSGKHIFIACDQAAEPFVIDSSIENAVSDIYTYQEYDLFKSNCYRHTWRWLSGEDRVIKSFKEFNRLLSGLTKQPIYWDKLSNHSLRN